MAATVIRTCGLTLFICSDAPPRLLGMCAPFVSWISRKIRTAIYTELRHELGIVLAVLPTVIIRTIRSTRGTYFWTK
jgi:hypothetical protein